MGLFSRNKDNVKDGVSSETQDWSKDLKRNTASKKVVSQQGFDFIKIIDTEGVLVDLETKKGLSINIENISSDQVKILKKCNTENTAAELIKILKRTNKTKFKQIILDPLINYGFFELTVPDKPKSPKQKYRFTGKFVHKKVRV
ncbi:MAG TPA: hypothetical protein EYI82_04735 [Gammaproteobacteria bacterium]|nr:hypothetical protein [Gammaproteobacteria bacterium]